MNIIAIGPYIKTSRNLELGSTTLNKNAFCRVWIMYIFFALAILYSVPCQCDQLNDKLVVWCIQQRESDISSRINTAIMPLLKNTNILCSSIVYEKENDPRQIFLTTTNVPDIVIGPDRSSALAALAGMATASGNSADLRWTNALFLSPFVTGARSLFEGLKVADTSVSDSNLSTKIAEFINSFGLKEATIFYTDDQWGRGLVYNLLTGQDITLHLVPVTEDEERKCSSAAETDPLTRRMLQKLKSTTSLNSPVVLVALQKNTSIRALLKAVERTSSSQWFGFHPKLLVLREPNFSSEELNSEAIPISAVSNVCNLSLTGSWQNLWNRKNGIYCVTVLNDKEAAKDWEKRTFVEALDDVVTVVNSCTSEGGAKRDQLGRIEQFYSSGKNVMDSKDLTKIKTAFHLRKAGLLEAEDVFVQIGVKNIKPSTSKAGLGQIEIAGKVWSKDGVPSIALQWFFSRSVFRNIWVLLGVFTIGSFTILRSLRKTDMIPMEVIVGSKQFWLASILNFSIVYLIWLAGILLGKFPEVGYFSVLWVLAVAYIGTGSIGLLTELSKRIPFGDRVVEGLEDWRRALLEQVSDELIVDLIEYSDINSINESNLREKIESRIQFRIRDVDSLENVRREAEKCEEEENDNTRKRRFLRLYYKVLRLTSKSDEQFIELIGDSGYIPEQNLKNIKMGLERNRISITEILARLKMFRASGNLPPQGGKL